MVEATHTIRRQAPTKEVVLHAWGVVAVAAYSEGCKSECATRVLFNRMYLHFEQGLKNLLTVSWAQSWMCRAVFLVCL